MDVADNHKPSLDREYIEGFLADVEKISREVSRDDIERVIQTLFVAWKENRQVFVMGNGGSASTATHLVSGLVKTINDKPGASGIRARALGDNIPLAHGRD